MPKFRISIQWLRGVPGQVFHRRADWNTRFRTLILWTLLLAAVSAATGSACSLFLWSLDAATRLRWEHPWLLYLLPVAGLAVGLVYHQWGKAAEAGNNLILDQIHEPGGGVPARMAPLILIGTVVTHLFGGSAGREGTAVQMGGSLAGTVARAVGLDGAQLRILLMAGIAGGFGAVFGTPLAGAVFALEVLTIGRIEYEALLPCLVAALASDWICHAWGTTHTSYHIGFAALPVDGHRFKVDGLLLVKVLAAAALFGLASALFSNLSHSLHAAFKRLVPSAPIRPVLGGVLVIGMTWLAGTPDYLGLGVTNPNPDGVSIVSFFNSPVVHPWSWLWKIGFTAVTLASGFKGGEVTPLFFIGAALGNALAGLFGAPPDLFAALGFVAVFAGAANTPLACTLMGIELFGSTHAIYIAAACFIAYLFSGHSGIYLSQRVAIPKRGAPQQHAGLTLRRIRELGNDGP